MEPLLDMSIYWNVQSHLCSISPSLAITAFKRLTTFNSLIYLRFVAQTQHIIYMEILLSPKKLIKMTTSLQKVPVIRRRKTSYRKASDDNSRMNSSAADKGTFVIYTLDKRRFVLPLSYLSNYMFQELFKMSEEEFGISSDDPIVFPCDSQLMNYIISLVKLGMSADLEKALLNSIIKNSCSISTSDCRGQTSLQLLLCGY